MEANPNIDAEYLYHLTPYLTLSECQLVQTAGYDIPAPHTNLHLRELGHTLSMLFYLRSIGISHSTLASGLVFRTNETLLAQYLRYYPNEPVDFAYRPQIEQSILYDSTPVTLSAIHCLWSHTHPEDSYQLLWCPSFCTLAAHYNKLHILRWLRNSQTGGGACPWDPFVCLFATTDPYIKTWIKTHTRNQ